MPTPPDIITGVTDEEETTIYSPSNLIRPSLKATRASSSALEASAWGGSGSPAGPLDFDDWLLPRSKPSVESANQILTQCTDLRPLGITSGPPRFSFRGIKVEGSAALSVCSTALQTWPGRFAAVPIGQLAVHRDALTSYPSVSDLKRSAQNGGQVKPAPPLARMSGGDAIRHPFDKDADSRPQRRSDDATRAITRLTLISIGLASFGHEEPAI